MPNRGFTKIPLKDDKILVKDLLDEVLKRRRLKGQGATRLQYRLEKQDQPGVVIDLEQKIGDLDTHDYCLVRENSVRGDIERDQEGLDESDIATSLSSHQYKSYEVTMTAKLGRSMDVQLGISGEKIEIDPHGKARFLKQKAVTHDTECLAACNLLDDKISTKLGKSTFRLVYHTGLEFRHHDFECETAQASEIVQKVNNIMDMRSSPIRKEYKVYKGQKKMQNPFKKRSSLSS